MNHLPLEFEFERGRLGASQLTQVLVEIGAELTQEGSSPNRRLRDAEINERDIVGIEFTAREPSQGFEPGTAILIGIATKLGADAATKLWNAVLWPEIKKRLGVDALGKRKL